MPFYVYAWITSITYALYAIVAKLIGKYLIKNPWQFSFFSILFTGIVTSIMALYFGATVPSQWGFIFLAAFFIALGSASYLFALKHLDVSIMAPLFNVRVVITVLMGWLFLGEVLTGRSIGLVLLVVGAGFFATMDEKLSLKSFFGKSVKLGLLFMLILSIQSIFVNRAIDQTDYWTALLWMGIFSVGFGFAMLYSKFKNDLKRTDPKKYLGVALLSVLGGLGDLSAYKAYESNVGISSVIISLPISMVLAFLFSVFKPELLEKHPSKVYAVRFGAAAIMIWGALQLSK